MNYLLEIRAFYDRLEVKPLSASAIALWHALMHTCNKTGWAEEFSVAVTVLSHKSGLSERSVANARNELKTKGYIDFKSRSGNRSAIYKLNRLSANIADKFSDSVSDNLSGSASDSVSGNPSILNKQNKTKQKKDHRRKYDDDSEYMKMAKYLLRKIHEWNPDYEAKNMQKWADDCRKILTIDKRDKKTIVAVIDWATSHHFWQSNILSPEKLRKQFQTLLAQMNSRNGNVVRFPERDRAREQKEISEQARIIAFNRWVAAGHSPEDIKGFHAWLERGADPNELGTAKNH